MNRDQLMMLALYELASRSVWVKRVLTKSGELSLGDSVKKELVKIFQESKEAEFPEFPLELVAAALDEAQNETGTI